MAKAINTILKNLQLRSKETNNVAARRRSLSINRYNNTVDITLRLSEQAKQNLLKRRKQREDSLQSLEDQYAYATRKVLSKQQLDALVKASQITAPTITSIYTGYELSRASEAERYRKALDKVSQRLERDNKLDVDVFKTDLADLGIQRDAAGRLLTQEQQNIRQDVTQAGATNRQLASTLSSDVLQEDRQAFSDEQQTKRQQFSDQELTKRQKFSDEQRMKSDEAALEREKQKVNRTSRSGSSFILPSSSLLNQQSQQVAPQQIITNQQPSQQGSLPLQPQKLVFGTPTKPVANQVNKATTQSATQVTEPKDTKINLSKDQYDRLNNIASRTEVVNAGINKDLAIKALATAVSQKNDGTGYGIFGIPEDEIIQHGYTVDEVKKDPKIADDIFAAKLMDSISENQKKYNIPSTFDIKHMPEEERKKLIEEQGKMQDQILQDSLSNIGFTPLPEYTDAILEVND